MAVWNLIFDLIGAPSPCPRKREIAYMAEIRSSNVYSRFGCRQLRFGRQLSCALYREQLTLIVRMSTLVVGKCLDVRCTLRIRVFSSRRRTFNVSFLRFIRERDSYRRKTFCAERLAHRAQQKDSRSSASAWSDVKSCRRRKLKPTLSSSFIVLNAGYAIRGVEFSHYRPNSESTTRYYKKLSWCWQTCATASRFGFQVK